MRPETQTLIAAIVGGVIAVGLGRAMRLPAIIPLLLLGIALGPEGLGLLGRPGQVLGGSLHAIVAIGVAIILFEGGLSLNTSHLRLAPKAVRNLISVGAVISMAGAATCAHYIADVEWKVALLYGALMIVTGPTVIMPLLKNVKVVPRVHTVLLWESILIDAVGAIAAVVTLEFVLENAGVDVVSAGSRLFSALVIGPAMGAGIGFLFARVLLWRKVRGSGDEETDRLFGIATAVGIYGLSENFFKEAGLGAVTCGGLVVAHVMREDAEELRRFKGTLTTLLVAVLFMILAANFEIQTLFALWPSGFLAIAGVILLVRPFNVMLCGVNSRLSWRDKVFVAWIGPRGIVAASVASLFSIVLAEHGDPQSGQLLVSLVFGTILVTVLLTGLTAWPLAWLLGLLARNASGVLVIGANELAVRVAQIIEEQGFPVVLVDTNPDLCKRVRNLGLRVINGSALDADGLAQQDLAGVGTMLALTSSSPVNVNACRRTARALQLSNVCSVITQSTSPEEALLLNRLGVKSAFCAKIDLSATYSLLREGKVEATSIKAGQAIRFADPFLPLIVVSNNGLKPYVDGESIPKGASVVGLSFTGLEADEVPFVPSVPHMKDNGVQTEHAR